jgi:hypothetical protein
MTLVPSMHPETNHRDTKKYSPYCSSEMKFFRYFVWIHHEISPSVSACFTNVDTRWIFITFLRSLLIIVLGIPIPFACFEKQRLSLSHDLLVSGLIERDTITFNFITFPSHPSNSTEINIIDSFFGFIFTDSLPTNYFTKEEILGVFVWDMRRCNRKEKGKEGKKGFAL